MYIRDLSMPMSIYRFFVDDTFYHHDAVDILYAGRFARLI